MNPSYVTYVEEMYPNLFVMDKTVKEVPPSTHPYSPPKDCIDYRFFRRAVARMDNGQILKGNPQDYTTWTYIGTKMDYDAVVKEQGADSVLAWNMKTNRLPYVVKFRSGNVIPITENDIVIPVN